MTNEAQSGKPSTTPRRKRFRIRWLRVFAALVILLLIAEIALRAIFGLAHPLVYQADVDCGYVPQPNQDITRFFSHNYINQHSMRSPEFSMPRPANTFRLLCVGDSVTYGLTYLSQDKIFTTRLAAALPQTVHMPVEVLNASAGGWAPGNEWGYLKSRGTFDANLVLFIWNTPDITQEFCPLPISPSFPTQRPYTAIGEAWSRYAMPRIFPGPPPPPDPGSTGASSGNAAQIAANLEMLLEAQAFAAKNNARFGLVFVESPGTTWQTAAFESDHQKLVEWMGAHSIPFLDLTAAFRAQGGEKLTSDGIHLRAEGHDVVTREIISHWDLFGDASKPAK